MTLDVGGLPNDLRDLRRYLPFCLRPRPNGRLGKVPHALLSGTLRPVDSRKREYWLHLADAATAVHTGRADGLGLVLGDGLGVVAADLDAVLHHGAVLPWASSIVTRLNGYAEISASGAGLHVLVRGQLPPGRRRAGRIEFLDSGFLALTGHRVPMSLRVVPHRQEALEAVYAQALPPPIAPIRPAASSLLSFADDEVLGRLLALRNGPRLARLLAGDRHGYPSDSEADFALARLLRFATEDLDQIERLMRTSALARARWDRPAGAGLTYLRRTVLRALDLGGPTLPPSPQGATP